MDITYQAECRECDWRGDYTEERGTANLQSVMHEAWRGHFTRIVELVR